MNRHEWLNRLRHSDGRSDVEIRPPLCHTNKAPAGRHLPSTRELHPIRLSVGVPENQSKHTKTQFSGKPTASAIVSIGL